jgi:hypothetical protein
VLGVGALGAGGWVAFGVNTIQTSLGNVDLVEVSGAATIIKRLGLWWPLMLLLAGFALLRYRITPLGSGAALVPAGLLLPISRIGNIWPLALVVDVLLLIGVTWATVALHDQPRPAGEPIASTVAR